MRKVTGIAHIILRTLIQNFMLPPKVPIYMGFLKNVIQFVPAFTSAIPNIYMSEEL